MNCSYQDKKGVLELPLSLSFSLVNVSAAGCAQNGGRGGRKPV